MAANVLDCAIGYLAIQGEDAHDKISLIQPHNDFQYLVLYSVLTVRLSHLEENVLFGLKMGVFDAWNRDAVPSVYSVWMQFSSW